MIAHRPRDADAARGTLGLGRRHVHYVAVDIEAIWNHIADVDAGTEAGCRWSEVAMLVTLLLHVLPRNALPVNALESDKQITCGIVKTYRHARRPRWVNQSAPENAEPF